MKKKFFGPMMALCCLIVSAQAFAVPVQLVDTVGSVTRNGVREGLYTLNIAGQEVLGMCDDFNTHVHIGQTWTADVYTYADVQSGSGKFASLTNALVRYSEVGWLYGQMSTSASHNANIQEAVWKVMGASPPMSTNGNSWYALATSGAHDAFDWSGTMKVVTSNPFSAAQEYLIPGVPIPPAVWLFGSGLVGLVGVARRRAPQ